MTGSQWPLVSPVQFSGTPHAVAVLCAVGGCDHGACHMGPFLVVYITFDVDDEGEDAAWVYVYSSKTFKWRERADIPLTMYTGHCYTGPFVLVAEAFYCLVTSTYPTRGFQVVKYNLGNNRLSVFKVPPMVADSSHIVPALVTAEDGGLGLAQLDMFSLRMWSYDDGVAEWTHHRIIDLKMLLPIGDHMISPKVVGSVEGTHTIFVATDLGVHMIDLSSLTSRNEGHNLQLSQKIYSMLGRQVYSIVPYVSFYDRPGTVHSKISTFARILFTLLFCTSFLEHTKQDLFLSVICFVSHSSVGLLYQWSRLGGLCRLEKALHLFAEANGPGGLTQGTCEPNLSYIQQ
jgi:hypothetical protein